MTQLQAGEMAPDFKSTTQDGEPLTLADLRGQRTILYFYPKDNTSGCTLEAKSLRDGKAELTRMGFRIIGVSPDSEKSHRSFCDKHDLNFTLLSDTDHSVCEAYGVWAEKSMYGRKYMGVLRTNDPLLLERGQGTAELYRDLKRDGKVFTHLIMPLLGFIIVAGVNLGEVRQRQHQGTR